MNKIIRTTTGTLSNQMILNHCGDYAGKFQDSAIDLLDQHCDLPKFEFNHWADIMYDNKGNVFAIWAEDSLTCLDADVVYLQLNLCDCPQAFKEMNEKQDI